MKVFLASANAVLFAGGKPRGTVYGAHSRERYERLLEHV